MRKPPKKSGVGIPTKEGRLLATPQLLLPASTPQALSVSELRKHSSCASLSFFRTVLDLEDGHSLAIVSGVPQFRNNALLILAAGKVNQSRCIQVTSAWV